MRFRDASGKVCTVPDTPAEDTASDATTRASSTAQPLDRLKALNRRQHRAAEPRAAPKPRVAGSKRAAEGSSDAEPVFAAQAASALGRGFGDSNRQAGSRRLDPSVLPLPDDEAGAAAPQPGFDRETAALKVGCCSCLATHA